MCILTLLGETSVQTERPGFISQFCVSTAVFLELRNSLFICNVNILIMVCMCACAACVCRCVCRCGGTPVEIRGRHHVYFSLPFYVLVGLGLVCLFIL